MWKQYNPNPCNKANGDCTVRAISKALNMSWDDAFDMQVYKAKYMCDMPSSNAVVNAILKDCGFVSGSISNKCPSCYTIKDFCRDNPKGIFVIGTGTHVVCAIDGTYFDSWDSGNETPIYYWRKA